MKTHILRLLTVLLVSACLVTACAKKGPCDAIVTVTDSLGRKVSGAVVVLRQDSITNPTNGVPATINVMSVTDVAGNASFSFQLEAVLILEAAKGTLSAHDYIRLEQSETVRKTVVIK